MLHRCRAADKEPQVNTIAEYPFALEGNQNAIYTVSRLCDGWIRFFAAGAAITQLLFRR